jgi:hypothetical protein
MCERDGRTAQLRIEDKENPTEAHFIIIQTPLRLIKCLLQFLAQRQAIAWRVNGTGLPPEYVSQSLNVKGVRNDVRADGPGFTGFPKPAALGAVHALQNTTESGICVKRPAVFDLIYERIGPLRLRKIRPRIRRESFGNHPEDALETGLQRCPAVLTKECGFLLVDAGLLLVDAALLLTDVGLLLVDAGLEQNFVRGS